MQDCAHRHLLQESWKDRMGSKHEDYRAFLRKLNSEGTTDWQERRRLRPRLRLCEMSSNEESGLWKAGEVWAGSSSNPSCVL